MVYWCAHPAPMRWAPGSYPTTARYFCPSARQVIQIAALEPGGYCIKFLLEKNSGYFNRSFFAMVKSMVKVMLT